MFLVALAFVPLEPGSAAEATVLALEWVITGIFIAEFGWRLSAAKPSRAYVRGHWIDLISCIPPTRWFRMFRLLRLLRLVRAFAGVGRAMTSAERLANHKGLVWLFIAWIGVMFLCAVGAYISEVGVNPGIQSPFDAIWWGLTTMTTVGLWRHLSDHERGTPRGGGAPYPGAAGCIPQFRRRLQSFLVAGERADDVAGQLEQLAASRMLTAG